MLLQPITLYDVISNKPLLTFKTLSEVSEFMSDYRIRRIAPKKYCEPMFPSRTLEFRSVLGWSLEISGLIPARNGMKKPDIREDAEVMYHPVYGEPYRFRHDPVPHIHKTYVGCWGLRMPNCHRALKNKAMLDTSEYRDIPLKRHRPHITSLYDDIWRSHDRSWKKQGKKRHQWDKTH